MLVEIGQILGSFQGKLAIVGGAVPWLLRDNADMPHVGTLNVDLGLNTEALGDGEYIALVEALRGNGYEQREELRRFQLVRQVPATDQGAPIDVIVDFLLPPETEILKHKPPLIENFALQRADGAELALDLYELVVIKGARPSGGRNRVEVAVCSIPVLLAMKGHALKGRYQQKDAYDVHYCARNYPGGIAALADACRPILGHASGEGGYRQIAARFNVVDAYGHTCVRRFVQDTAILGERSFDQWQEDA